MRRSFLVVLLGAFILSACGGAPPPADEGAAAPDLAVVNPASAFEPGGDFAPGRARRIDRQAGDGPTQR